MCQGFCDGESMRGHEDAHSPSKSPKVRQDHSWRTSIRRHESRGCACHGPTWRTNRSAVQSGSGKSVRKSSQIMLDGTWFAAPRVQMMPEIKRVCDFLHQYLGRVFVPFVVLFEIVIYIADSKASQKLHETASSTDCYQGAFHSLLQGELDQVWLKSSAGW